MIYVGIDTGTNTGIAVWDSSQKKLLECYCTKIHKAMRAVELLKQHADKSNVGFRVRIEDARKRTWFGTERMGRDEERKKLQGVGSVKRDASIWEDFLKDLGVDFELVAPKDNVTKINQQYFKIVSGWKGKTNEHARDAGMLVVGY